jgi:hypothetical protein
VSGALRRLAPALRARGVEVEFTRDNGILRNGASGDSLLLLWSKIF